MSSFFPVLRVGEQDLSANHAEGAISVAPEALSS